MDEVHGLRDAYAVDMVLMHWGHLTGTGGGLTIGSVAGVAVQMESLSGNYAPHAFSVANSFAFAHELGHNMGLRHHRANDPGNTPFPYSHGHAVYDSEGFLQFSTIMAAGGPHRAPRFSNPRQWHSDESGNRIRMGVPGGRSVGRRGRPGGRGAQPERDAAGGGELPAQRVALPL